MLFQFSDEVHERLAERFAIYSDGVDGLVEQFVEVDALRRTEIEA
ncbi:hypothetical protein [Hankyongella ginsenosidimutans]|nr:hypothetical protein [Hankyongella ginsenosidimutans]